MSSSGCIGSLSGSNHGYPSFWSSARLPAQLEGSHAYASKMWLVLRGGLRRTPVRPRRRRSSVAERRASVKPSIIPVSATGVEPVTRPLDSIMPLAAISRCGDGEGCGRQAVAFRVNSETSTGGCAAIQIRAQGPRPACR